MEFWIAEEYRRPSWLGSFYERVDITFPLYNIRREEPAPHLLAVPLPIHAM